MEQDHNEILQALVQIKIERSQSLKIYLEGAEGFPLEFSYEDIAIAVGQKMSSDASNVKYRNGCQSDAKLQAANLGYGVGQVGGLPPLPPRNY